MNWLSIRQIVSNDEIIKLENELHINLPVDYKRIISKINGGALKSAYVEHAVMGK